MLSRTDRDRQRLARAFAAAGLQDIADRLRDLRPMPPACYCFRGMEPATGWLCSTCNRFAGCHQELRD